MRDSVKDRQSGFSLIEILVVVMVVGIAMGGVSVFFTTGGPEEEMKKAVGKFAIYSAYASQLAVLSGEPMGLMLEPPEWRENPLDEGWRYRWQKMTLEGWVDDMQLESIELPKAMELSILIDDHEWAWENAPEIREPIIAFYPSGDITPFSIEFRHEELDGNTQTVNVDVWGEVVWKEQAELAKEREEERERYR